MSSQNLKTTHFDRLGKTLSDKLKFFMTLVRRIATVNIFLLHDDKRNAVDLNKWIMQYVLLRVQKLNSSFFLLVCRLFSVYSCMPGKPCLSALLPASQCLACQSSHSQVADSWSLCFIHEPEAKFLVPYRGDIVDSNLGLSYQTSSLCGRLYPPVRGKESGYVIILKMEFILVALYELYYLRVHGRTLLYSRFFWLAWQIYI
jgi:hypothetical protein